MHSITERKRRRIFPITKSKDGFSEDIRKFLIEHELGRMIATMIRRELDALIDQNSEGGLKWNYKSKEPVARFLSLVVSE